MADKEYANGRGIFQKESAGKSMAAMPDVCIPPPPPPAPPVPTPFPNNATAADLTGCAPSVLTCGNPTAHRKSNVSKSTGNEPADPKASGQAAVVTHVIEGAAYFQSHSMDVLFENIEAVRHLDMTTHNHASQPLGSTPPAPMTSSMDFSGPWTVSCGPDCQLSSYDPNRCPKIPGTTKRMTPHHIIPKHCFKAEGRGARDFAPEWPDYDPNKAACICVTGSGKKSADAKGNLLEHGRIHAAFDLAEALAGLRPGPLNEEANQWSFEEAKTTGVAATNKTLRGRCDPECVAAVIDATHKGDRNKPLRAKCPAKKTSQDRIDAITLKNKLSISPAKATEAAGALF